MINKRTKVFESKQFCIKCRRSPEAHEIILNRKFVCTECNHLTNDFASQLFNTYKGFGYELPRFAYQDLPPYLRAKKVAKGRVGLPAGIKWNTTTKIMFNHLRTLEAVLRWRSENKKPIYITVEGESGEGKTNVLIWLLKWMLIELTKGMKCKICNKYENRCFNKLHTEKYYFAGIELTVKNFYDYFYTKRSLNLDPRIITRKHDPKDTICVDEFHLLMPHHASKANRAVIDFVDTAREFPLYLIGATPSAMRLDSNYFAFRNVIQIIVDYTSIRNKWTKFDVLVNALGVNSKGERNWRYVFLELDRRINFQDPRLWELSRRLKYENVYGESSDAFVTFNEQERIDYANAKKDTLVVDMGKVLNDATTATEAVIELLQIKKKVGRRLSYETIASTVNEYFTKETITWRRIKAVEARLMKQKPIVKV